MFLGSCPIIYEYRQYSDNKYEYRQYSDNKDKQTGGSRIGVNCSVVCCCVGRLAVTDRCDKLKEWLHAFYFLPKNGIALATATITITKKY